MSRWIWLLIVAAILIGRPAGGAPVTLTPAELAAMLPRKDFVLVNVHVPYEGEIGGTDLFLPFDGIDAALHRLPADRRRPIVVYCRSGRMSAMAAATLARLGYVNVRDLAGGMVAWQQAGYPLGRTDRAVPGRDPGAPARPAPRRSGP